MHEIQGKKIFISGGEGFIASHLIKRLVGNNKIVVYDNFTRNAIRYISPNKYPKLKIIHGDILDASLLKSSVKGCNIFIH